VHRLAEVSVNIIDQCYARCHWHEYGGLLDNRSLRDIGSKNFYAKGQTGQQLLGAYSAMNRQIGRGKIKSIIRHERFGSD
jgi:succinate dehydrogenase / fumarate reductase flavoprotein subunit